MNSLSRTFLACAAAVLLVPVASFAQHADYGRGRDRWDAGPGQLCSVNGYYYPACARPYSCANPDRNGVGICAMRCRSDYDCGRGSSCYAGSCYQNNGRNDGRDGCGDHGRGGHTGRGGGRGGRGGGHHGW